MADSRLARLRLDTAEWRMDTGIGKKLLRASIGRVLETNSIRNTRSAMRIFPYFSREFRW